MVKSVLVRSVNRHFFDILYFSCKFNYPAV